MSKVIQEIQNNGDVQLNYLKRFLVFFYSRVFTMLPRLHLTYHLKSTIARRWRSSFFTFGIFNNSSWMYQCLIILQQTNTINCLLLCYSFLFMGLRNAPTNIANCDFAVIIQKREKKKSLHFYLNGLINHLQILYISKSPQSKIHVNYTKAL